MVSVPHDPYATGVSCRVQALAGQARVASTADDDETVADYLLVVPIGVDDARIGDLATLTSTGDVALDGVVLRVVQVVLGTERFERDLFCTLVD